jgi:hypothetical protein
MTKKKISRLLITSALVLLCSAVHAQNIYPPPVTFAGEPYNTQPIAPNFFAYVTNHDSGTVSGYAVNIPSGGLTPVNGSPFSTGGSGSGPISVAVDPTGRCAVVTTLQSGTVGLQPRPE